MPRSQCRRVLPRRIPRSVRLPLSQRVTPLTNDSLATHADRRRIEGCGYVSRRGNRNMRQRRCRRAAPLLCAPPRISAPPSPHPGAEQGQSPSRPSRPSGLPLAVTRTAAAAATVRRESAAISRVRSPTMSSSSSAQLRSSRLAHRPLPCGVSARPHATTLVREPQRTALVHPPAALTASNRAMCRRCGEGTWRAPSR